MGLCLAALSVAGAPLWLSLTIGVKMIQIFCTNDKETVIFEQNFMIEYFIFELGCSNSEKKSIKMRSKQQTYTRVVKGRETRHFPVV